MTMEKCPCCCWMTMMFPCFFAHLYLGACRRLDLPALAWRDPPKIEAFQIVSTFVRVTVLPFVDTFQHLGLWGKNGIFLNDPKSRYRFFTRIVFSDKKCDFSSFLWVWKHPCSRVNCHLLFSFRFIKDTGFRKLICSNRSYPPKCSRFLSYFMSLFVIVYLSFWRPVQVATPGLHEHVLV